jgi:hypothetical protein
MVHYQRYNNQYEIQFSQQNTEWLEHVIIPLIENVFKIKTVVKSYGGQTQESKYILNRSIFSLKNL